MTEKTEKPAEIKKNGKEPAQIADKPAQRVATLRLELTPQEIVESLMRDRPGLFVGFDSMEYFGEFKGGAIPVVEMVRPIVERANASEVI